MSVQVTVEVRSPFAGRIIETFSQEGDEINVGEPLFVIEPGSGDAAAAPAAAPAAPVAPAKAAVKAAHTPATPAPKSAPSAAKAPTPPPKAASAAPVSAPAVSAGNRGETRVKMTRMRLRIAQVCPCSPHCLTVLHLSVLLRSVRCLISLTSHA